jgi:hypothetical protein
LYRSAAWRFGGQPYDELPLHRTPQPVLELPNSDPGFDDGYYFGVFDAPAQVFCFMGLRVSPNTDRARIRTSTTELTKSQSKTDLRTT